jgi:TonB family protein
MRTRSIARVIYFTIIALVVGPVAASQDPSTPSISSIGVEAVRVVIPEYPDVARVARISGLVEVAVRVDGHGSVVASVAKSSNPMFDVAALQAATKWHLALEQGKTATLLFQFTSLPACSVPPQVAIYTPPFAVEVFAASSLGTCDDCREQPSCPQVEIVKVSGE